MGTIRSIVSEFGNMLNDFAFPPICSGCERYVEAGDVICERCMNSLLVLDEPTCLFCDRWLVDKQSCPECERTIPLYAMGQYGGPLERMIVNLKFHAVTRVADQLCLALLDLHADGLAALDVDAIVPLPLAPWREYRRGYNQAMLIAERIQSVVGAEVNTGLLQRSGWRPPQSRLKLHRRAENIRGVFRTRPCDQPNSILLVDDVVTSGSTMREAVSTLESDGHRVIATVALARA